MKHKSILAIVLVPAVLLLVPWVAMRFTDEVNWSGSDFVIAWVLMASTGFAYRMATRATGNLAYRAAAAIAVLSTFAIVWLNLAVGIIGSENNPANLLYSGVLAVELIGAIVARLRPEGMARALFATACAQFLVPVIAVIIWRPNFSPCVLGVFALNACFVALFVGSALLFRSAARQSRGIDQGAMV